MGTQISDCAGSLGAPNFDRRQLIFFVLEIANKQRLPTGNDHARDAFSQRPPLRRFVYVLIDPDAKVQLVGLIVVEGDEERFGRHDACNFAMDDPHQIVEVQGGADGARDAIEQRQPLGPL